MRRGSSIIPETKVLLNQLFPPRLSVRRDGGWTSGDQIMLAPPFIAPRNEIGDVADRLDPAIKKVQLGLGQE